MKKDKGTNVSGKHPRTTGCIRKCCDLGKSLTTITHPITGQIRVSKCAWSNISFAPKMYSTKSHRPLSNEEAHSLDLHITKAPPRCENGTGTMFCFLSKKKSKLFPGTSSLCYKSLTDESFYHQDEKCDYSPRTGYCVERVQGTDKQESEEWLEYEGPVTCSRPKNDPENDS
ncbi:unnamed protein product [Allacma fusca]|uniref:Uncharacterized protein n=1 Tax=Allacma fusca TaxID=39272 RepID=A0A8J2JW69_9HEXA|nr:unnamed protein product [Allacma fusca]